MDDILVQEHKRPLFWVNNRPGGFGNYAAGYAGFMAFGYGGTALNHFFGAAMEKWSQYVGEVRPDGFQNRPWWNWRDGPIDRKLIKEGARDARRDTGPYISKSIRCPVSK